MVHKIIPKTLTVTVTIEFFKNTINTSATATGTAAMAMPDQKTKHMSKMLQTSKRHFQICSICLCGFYRYIPRSILVYKRFMNDFSRRPRVPGQDMPPAILPFPVRPHQGEHQASAACGVIFSMAGCGTMLKS